MEKAKEILKHIEDLYNKTEVTDEAIDSLEFKRPEMYNSWKDAFENYDLVDVLNAIDEYWKFTNNTTRPRVSHLLAMLNTKKDIRHIDNNTPKVRYFNIESEFMARDIELGKNCDCILSDYKRAVDYILGEKLLELIGGFEYRKLDLSQKYKLAIQNGLFDNFDDIMLRLKNG